jgi:hypothetical protein
MASRNWILAFIGASGICVSGLMIAPSFAQPAAPPSHRNQCFFVNQFENWRAPDTRTINIRVQGNHYFRLGLGGECYPLRSGSARLITRFRGSSTICSPLDWDVQVSEGIGSPPQPCLVKTMTELSPAEVAALLPKDKP